MEGESNEFANEPVPVERTGSWIGVALISAMVAFSLPTFVAGVELFAVSDYRSAIIAVVTGGALLALIGGICGVIGARTRLSSYMLAKVAFGYRGAALVNVAFAISLLGWFGVNIDLFSETALRMLADIWGVQAPVWLIELIAGVIMTMTTLYGFRAISGLSMLLTPVLMLVTALLWYQIAGASAGHALWDEVTVSTLSFGDSVSAVVGGVIIGAVILPDITRFIRHWQGAVYTALLSYLVVGSVVMIAGGLAAQLFAQGEFLDVMMTIGLGSAAFVIVIAGSWVLNTLNLYSTALSIAATAPRVPNHWLVLGLGALGTLAAFANILDYFLDFLFYLAIVFVPVAGVIAVDYTLLRRAAYHDALDPEAIAVSWAALLSWFAGAVVALLGAEGVITLSGIAAVDAIAVSAGCYALAGRWSTRPTPASDAT
ncbi:MAG: cytosine permease [Pseudomonadota bacterium]